MTVFLDANVLFTAVYNPEGVCAALFSLASAGRCELLVSAFVVDEARRTLALKAAKRAPALESLLRVVLVVPEPGPSLVSRARSCPIDEKDAPVLAAAVAARCDLLVTGDRRHFGHLCGQNAFGVKVLTPAEAFDLLVPS